MKKALISLILVSSFSVWGSSPIEVEANGYGGNDKLACISAKAEAKSKLKEWCTHGKLKNISFNECTFVTEGDYFLVFSIRAKADCL